MRLLERLTRRGRGGTIPPADAIDGGRGPELLDLTGEPLDGFDALAGAAASGTNIEAALDEWLLDTRPSTAVQLVHVALCHTRRTLDGDRQRRIAGRARHDVHLLKSDPKDPPGALAAVAMVFVGLAFPALPEATDLRDGGLRVLAEADVLAADGLVRGDLGEGARLLWALVLLRAALVRQHLHCPARVDGTLVAGSQAYHHVAGELWRLPSAGLLTPLVPLGPAPLLATIVNCVRAWGLDEGPFAWSPDPVCRGLTGKDAGEVGRPHAGPEWRLWTFRDSGIGVGHRTIRSLPARLFLDGGKGELTFDLGGDRVVRSTFGAGSIRRARVDGTDLRFLVPGPESAVRDITAQKARVLVKDQGMARIAWEFGPDLVPVDQGYEASVAGGKVTVKLDPAWSWTREGNTLVGTGTGDVTTSIEVK